MHSLKKQTTTNINAKYTEIRQSSASKVYFKQLNKLLQLTHASKQQRQQQKRKKKR